MPSFHCKAVHAEGSLIDEVREAVNIDSLVRDLQREGYVPIKVEPANVLLSHLFRPTKKRLKNKQILTFTQELATLLQAELPLDYALKTMLSLTEALPEINTVVEFSLKKVKQGVALSETLEQQNCGFSRFYIGIIKAGEAGGDIAGSLQHLSDYLERSESLRGTVISALVYPAILLFTSVASIVLLMTLVLPQFAELFDNAGKELPLPTEIVMSISHGLQKYWWALVLFFIGIVLFLQHILNTPHLRYKWDRYSLDLPVVGDLIKKIEVTRFSHTLGSLLEKGVPLLDALVIVKSTMSNSIMVEFIDLARQHLKQGRMMSTAFSADAQFPKMAIQMIKLGEETGNLQGILGKLSTTYDREVKVSVQRMLSLFEPILILLLGVIIAGIIFSVLMAIVNINDFAF